MKEVSEFLGNTPTLARTAYVDPRVVEAYERGRTIKVRGKYDTADARQAALERAVLKLLAPDLTATSAVRDHEVDGGR